MCDIGLPRTTQLAAATYDSDPNIDFSTAARSASRALTRFASSWSTAIRTSRAPARPPVGRCADPGWSRSAAQGRSRRRGAPRSGLVARTDRAPTAGAVGARLVHPAGVAVSVPAGGQLAELVGRADVGQAAAARVGQQPGSSLVRCGCGGRLGGVVRGW